LQTITAPQTKAEREILTEFKYLDMSEQNQVIGFAMGLRQNKENKKKFIS
jgi:hypothetical protein